MRRLSVFETVSVDGYFTDANNDMSWAHAGEADVEWNEYVSGNVKRAEWKNTTLIKDDLVGAVRRLKNEPGGDMVILGSGSIVAQLAAAALTAGPNYPHASAPDTRTLSMSIQPRRPRASRTRAHHRIDSCRTIDPADSAPGASQNDSTWMEYPRHQALYCPSPR